MSTTGLTALVDYSVVLYIEARLALAPRGELVEKSVEPRQDMAGMDDGQLSSVQLVRAPVDPKPHGPLSRKLKPFPNPDRALEREQLLRGDPVPCQDSGLRDCQPGSFCSFC